jgi:hypothetical protein
LPPTAGSRWRRRGFAITAAPISRNEGEKNERNREIGLVFYMGDVELLRDCGFGVMRGIGLFYNILSFTPIGF